MNYTHAAACTLSAHFLLPLLPPQQINKSYSSHSLRPQVSQTIITLALLGIWQHLPHQPVLHSLRAQPCLPTLMASLLVSASGVGEPVPQQRSQLCPGRQRTAAGSSPASGSKRKALIQGVFKDRHEVQRPENPNPGACVAIK